MKIAIIDMGTNTFHLLLAEVNGDEHTIIRGERSTVKIGEKGINRDEITAEAWDRAIKSMNEFNKVIHETGISKVFATATSAVRNAKNGKLLVEEIKIQTGIEVEIISGTREAELILLGVKKALDLGSKKNLVMDIGGGSIEFIIADNKKTHWLKSFEMGGQRLVEKFHKNDPISRDEINQLWNYFDCELKELKEMCEVHRPATLVGCSGTFDTLSDICCAESNIPREESATEYPITLDAFSEIFQDLLYKTRTERLKIPGMVEIRVDMIVVACIMVDHLIQLLHLENIRVSAYALKEGVLMHQIDSVRNSMKDNQF